MRQSQYTAQNNVAISPPRSPGMRSGAGQCHRRQFKEYGGLGEIPLRADAMQYAAGRKVAVLLNKSIDEL